jgi:hypothetical protein
VSALIEEKVALND